ncbi:ESPR-type extended signal peptide-containing protein [Psychrobacter sp.]|uniref:ESPR-type extended signal peptide-containing protein n=1 Tax=Psychrobacter sp. TaxID=56811 RepID=UPI0025FAFE54|nr:ESPR-type extended signal peptide-containing protein [Psychrobacter sp.]
MNHIYKVIFNKATATFVAVAEHAKGQGKKSIRAAGSASKTSESTINSGLVNINLLMPSLLAMGIMTGLGLTVSANAAPTYCNGNSYFSDSEYQATYADTQTVCGKKGFVGGENSTVLGYQSTTAKAISNQTALGANSSTTINGAVALGANSTANRAALASTTTSATATGSTNEVYAPTSASTTTKTAVTDTVKGSLGAVSVGNSTSTRQIINVAAGSDNTDAVNVAQLKAVADLAAPKDMYFHVNNGTNSGTGVASSNLGKVDEAGGATAMNALAAGVGAKASGGKAVSVGTNSIASGGNSIAIGENAASSSDNTIAIGSDTIANTKYATAIGRSSNSTGSGSTAIGGGSDGNAASADGAGAVAIGGGYDSSNAGAKAKGTRAVAIGNASSVSDSRGVAIGYASSATKTDAIALGSQSVANRAALTNATTSSSALASSNTVYALDKANTADKTAIASTVVGNLGAVSVGKADSTRQITNVAAGSDNTDAVNVSQLKAVANVASSPLTVIGNELQDTNNDGSQQTLGSTIAITGGGTAASSNNNVKTVVTDGKVDIQLLDAPTFTGVVTANGFNANNNKITNVADGAISDSSKDAINGSQLNTAINTLNKDTYFHVNKADGSNAGTGNATTNLGKVEDSAGAAGATSVTAGENARATGDRGIAVGFSAEAAGGNATAIGYRAQAQNEQSIAIGYRTEAQGVGTTSLGAQSGRSTAGNGHTNVGALAGAYASGTHNTSLGMQAGSGISDTNKNVGIDNVSVGFQAGQTVEGSRNTALGSQSGRGVKGGQNSAVGNWSGQNVTGSGNSTLGYRSGQQITGQNNLALGIGSGNNVKGNSNIAIGESAGINLGTTTESINNTISIGERAQAETENAIALGSESQAKVKNSIALGSASIATRDIPTTSGYDIVTNTNSTISDSTWRATRAAVSVGDVNSGLTRQITSLAAGSEDTDAVNVAQLKQVTQTPLTFIGNELQDTNNDGSQQSLGSTIAITGGATAASSNNNVKTVVTDGKVDIQLLNAPTFTGVVTANGFNANNNKIINVAIGTADTDAVNVSQLKMASATSKTEVAAGTNVKDVVKTTGDDGQDIYTVNANGTTASAGSTAVTVVGTEGANNVTDYVVDLNQTTKDAIANGQKHSTVVKGNNVTVDTGSNANGGVEYTVNAEKSTVSSTSLDVTGTTDNATDITDYKVELTQGAKDSLANADSALQTVVTQINGTGVKTLNKADNVANFQNGDNIVLTDNNGSIKVATAKDVSFDSVTANTITAGTVAADTMTVNNADSLAQGGSKDYVTQGSQDVVNGGDVFNAISNTQQQFKGDNAGVTITRKPSEVLSLVGGATSSTENNIQTLANADGTIAIKLAEQVDLGTNGRVTMGGVNLSNTGLDNGNNKIINVAIGTADTDAVNVSQLKMASATSKTEVAAGTNVKDVVKTTGDDGQDIYTVNANGTTASAGSTAVTVVGTEGANNVTDYVVDLNQTTKDAIANGQKHSTVVKGNNVTVDTGSNANGGVEYTVNAEKSTVSSTSLDVTGTTDNATDITDYKVELTQGAKDSLANADSALQTVVTQINGTGVKTLNKADNVANFQNGDNIVLTDNNGSIKVATAKDVSFDSVTANTITAGTVSVGPVSIENTGINAGNTVITNIKAGVKDSDAVNVSQLKVVSGTADNALQSVVTQIDGKDVKTLNKASNTANFATGNNMKLEEDSNGGIKVSTSDSVTFSSVAANNMTVESVGNTPNSVTNKKYVDDGRTKVTSNNGSVSVTQTASANGNNYDLSVNTQGIVNSAQLPVVYTDSQGNKVYKVGDTFNTAMDGSGNSVETSTIIASLQNANGSTTTASKLSNIAEGKVSADSNDAINGSQLHATNLIVDQNKKDIVNNSNQIATNTVSINKGLNVGDGSTTNNYKLGDTVNVTGDSNITTKTTANGVKVGLKDDITVKSVTTGNTLVDNNGITVTNHNMPSNSVSVTNQGLDNGGNTITNVAPGVQGTDAANINQLNDLGYKLAVHMDNLEDQLSAGIASAAAIENAPYVAGKWTYAAGASHYNSQSAVGISLRRTADNGRWSINGGVSTNTKNDPLFRIGVSGVIE